jgi:putative FmdB family regulatory protein
MTKRRGRVPTYDYRCTKCGDTFAVEQSIRDKPLSRCRKCRGKLEKMLPRKINLIFKGSGFYVTDYKKSGAHGKRAARSKEAGAEKAEARSARNGSKDAEAKEAKA